MRMDDVESFLLWIFPFAPPDSLATHEGERNATGQNAVYTIRSCRPDSKSPVYVSVSVVYYIQLISASLSSPKQTRF